MKIHELKRSKGFKDKKIQRGRGDGSGRGNFSGKGCKGQQARAGFSLIPSFEGGQTPTVQRFPKRRGFKRYFKLVDDYSTLNINTLEKDERITSGMDLNKEVLAQFGYVKAGTLVKVLGDGELNKSLNFTGIDKFSKTAQEKIEKAGGKIS